jgi:hypothetical protein
MNMMRMMRMIVLKGGQAAMIAGTGIGLDGHVFLSGTGCWNGE